MMGVEWCWKWSSGRMSPRDYSSVASSSIWLKMARENKPCLVYPRRWVRHVTRGTSGLQSVSSADGHRTSPVHASPAVDARFLLEAVLPPLVSCLFGELYLHLYTQGDCHRLRFWKRVCKAECLFLLHALRMKKSAPWKGGSVFPHPSSASRCLMLLSHPVYCFTGSGKILKH